MAPEYLIEIDKDLAEILLLRSDKLQSFNSKTTQQKTDLLDDIINKCQGYFDQKKNFMDILPLPVNVPRKLISTSADIFYHLLAAILKTEHIRVIGTNAHHGEMCQYMEYKENKLFVSYFSEAHPAYEFRSEFDFFEYAKINTDKVFQILPVTDPIPEKGRGASPFIDLVDSID